MPFVKPLTVLVNGGAGVISLVVAIDSAFRGMMADAVLFSVVAACTLTIGFMVWRKG